MEDKVRCIIVPIDFSEVAQYALDHTVRIAKFLNDEIMLVHIVNEPGLFGNQTKTKLLIDDATLRLSKMADTVEKEFGLRPKIIVKPGSIFSTINEITNELHARLVVMGTHGIHGKQRFTGSYALRVMANSKVPYIVVQSPYEYRPDNDIVFPVDHHVENKEKLVWANYMAKNFGAKIQLFLPDYSDEGLKKRTIGNLNFAKKFLEEKGVEYAVTFAPKKGKFNENLIQFAKEQNTNLILIMITKELSFQDYLFAAEEQKIIANSEKITVMCVNPRTDLRKVGGFN
jgi:nucleotide-binding universal stress UspA family protein